MRKSLVGAILCVMVTYNASASIISRGFFDEAMENYATNTALDLKANQSDLVNLSNIVGTPMELTYGDILGRSYIRDIMGDLYSNTYAENTVPTNDISELIRLNYTDPNFPGLAGVVESLFMQRDRDDRWPIRLNYIFNDYAELYYSGNYSFYDLIINGGTVLFRDDLVTVYGLKDLTTKVDTNTAKIGTLPTTAHLFTDHSTTGWGQTTITLPETIAGQLDLIFHNINDSNCKQYGFNYDDTIYSIPKITKLLNFIIAGIPKDDNKMFLDCGVWYKFRNLQELTSDIDTKIGTLPDGLFPVSINHGNLFPWLNQPAGVYPTSLAELITAIYGNPNTDVKGLLEAIITGFPYNSTDGPLDYIGIVPNAGEISQIKFKIGDLPTEYATVGAALTAMKSDIDAKNLPSTSDDGQYVLTAKKVGDTITYTWVKMDLTNEEQAQ